MQRIRPLELFLLETILFLGLWFWNEYVAFLLSLLLASISFFILLIALIAELLERSKVPRAYFWSMGVICIVPILVIILMTYATEGAIFESLFSN